MRERLLLCTDMDRTLLPNGDAPETNHIRQYFTALCNLPEVILVYVTGRDKALVEDAITQYQLPQPDYVISDVGSKLYRVNMFCWHEVPEWLTEMDQAWHGHTYKTIAPLLSQFDQLSLQEPSKQNDHKLSYYTPLNLDKTDLFTQIHTTLKQHQIDANLIWSVDEASQVGLLDILPPNATKRHAIEHLQTRLDFSLNEILFAGDSGNDLAVLASPIPSVLVHNASSEVRKEAIQLAAKADNTTQLYLAHETKSDNGNYAAGILQGVWHFHPHLRFHLQTLGVDYDPNL